MKEREKIRLFKNLEDIRSGSLFFSFFFFVCYCSGQALLLEFKVHLCNSDLVINFILSDVGIQKEPLWATHVESSISTKKI